MKVGMPPSPLNPPGTPRNPLISPFFPSWHQVTSFGMASTYGLVAASGPAWDDVPPFRWSTSPCSHLLHMGHPDLWKFPPVKVRWD